MYRYWTLALCLFGLAALATETPAATRSIGFRNDGTGIFPADCAPPATFDGVKGLDYLVGSGLNRATQSMSPLTGADAQPQGRSDQCSHRA
jgi:hypothetical protein